MLHHILNDVQNSMSPDFSQECHEQIEELLKEPKPNDVSWMTSMFTALSGVLSQSAADIDPNKSNSQEPEPDNSSDLTNETVFYCVAEAMEGVTYVPNSFSKDQLKSLFIVNEDTDFFESYVDANEVAAENVLNKQTSQNIIEFDTTNNTCRRIKQVVV